MLPKPLHSLMSALSPYANLIVRVLVGAIMLAHGLQKFGNPAMVKGMVASLGFPAPEVFAWVLILVEAVGGALLILGLLTRYAALSIMIAMLVAVFGVHLKNGFIGQGGYEYPLLIAAVCLRYFVKGGGKLSLDKAFFKDMM